MAGEKELEKLIKSMRPKLQDGQFVFCSLKELAAEHLAHCLMQFREEEGITVIVSKGTADQFNWEYSFVASWITLTVHSSLEAVGLTAAFSKALSDAQISCNVVAAFYHDHIFVDVKDGERALEVLLSLGQTTS